MTVASMIDEAAERWPDSPWLIHEGRTVSFGEWATRTRQAGAAWSSLGIGEGDRVLLALRNTPSFLAAWHGLNRIGAVMVPLNLQFRSREAGYVARHSEAATALTWAEHEQDVLAEVAEEVATLERVINVGGPDGFDAAVEAADPSGGIATRLDQPASVLYTSGTTGPPKGCVMPQEHFVVSGRVLAHEIRLTASSTKLVMLPLFHMNSENSVMATIEAGSRAVLRDGFSASAYWSEVHEQGVTHGQYLGSILPILDKRSDELEHGNPLEVLWGAGCSAGALERLEDRWDVRIIEVFGMTETGMDLCNPYDGPRVPGSCGTPVEGREVRLVDDHDAEVPVGEVGELTFRRAPGMTLGYLNDEEATAALFRDGWLHTGDLASRDADHYYYFVDREKDIIRRSGENISSAEVEGVLQEHADVVQAACIPMPDELRDEEVHAVVVLRDGRGPDDCPPDRLRSWCEDRLAEFKAPRYIEYVDELPETPTGKVRKQQLRDRDKPNGVYDTEADREASTVATGDGG